MARRSVGNDRYRVEQKGHTRKSASAAKPKRGAGVAAGSDSAKKKAPAKKTAAGKTTPRWGRGPSRAAGPRFESTPQIKQLRRYWWILIGVALALAVAMLFTNSLGNKALDSALLGLYAAALCGSLYLEFGPLRKARLAAIAEARAKGGKGPKPVNGAKPEPKGAAEVPVPEKPKSFLEKAREAMVGAPKLRDSEGVLDVPLASDNDVVTTAAEEASGTKDDDQT
jgi:hypothetical protein